MAPVEAARRPSGKNVSVAAVPPVKELRAAARVGAFEASLRHATSVSWASITAFVTFALLTKVFALLASTLRFGRHVTSEDMLSAAGPECLLGVAGLLAWRLIACVEVRRGNRRVLAGVRLGLTLLQVLLLVGFGALALFYVLSGYVFLEWGAFLDHEEYLMALHSPTPDSVRGFLLRPTGLVVLASPAALVFLITCLWRLRRRSFLPEWPVLILAVASAGVVVTANRRAPDPATASPLLVALNRPQPLARGGAEPPLIVGVDSRPIPAEFHGLQGAAAERDLVIVVLESTPRHAVNLGGEPRPAWSTATDPMPHLRSMAATSLVCHAAYVGQPRSAKALESILLGISPYPREEALSWNPERIRGRPTLLRPFERRGYRFYFAVGGETEWDGFGPAIAAAIAHPLSRSVGTTELVHEYGAIAKPPGMQANDLILVQDYLRWYAAQKGPSLGIIWLAGGHHPYAAPFKVYPEKADRDRHANCLYSSDLALKLLTDGVERVGRRPVIVIFGDHGESFGEHPGDRLHGQYLYDPSIRIPFLINDPALFPRRVDFHGRFSLKDVPATLFYLWGVDERMRESDVMFRRCPDDPLYFSNVYGDFKLGTVRGNQKFFFAPDTGKRFLFDLAADPEERNNLAAASDPQEMARLETDVLGWYRKYGAYVEREFPIPAPARAAR